MSVPDTKAGQIVTFYSYKGGTGRSMALANTACLLGRRLARDSQRVLAIDWDIDAPGLHHYFPIADSSAHRSHPGIVDYFWELQSLLDKTAYKKMLKSDQGWIELRRILPLDPYIIPDVAEGVDLIKAGRFFTAESQDSESNESHEDDDDYGDRVTSFKWAEFYNRYHAAFRCFREYIANLYPWCLIDSRTGLSDVSGICTMLMPEKLVAVYTPNLQSVGGLLDLVKRAVAYRAESDDPRPLAVFPLPSRFVSEEQAFVRAARQECREAFQKCFQIVYRVEKCDLSSYFDAVEIPHLGFYGFRERVAVRDDASQTVGTAINRAYERFYERLFTLDYAWEPWDEATKRLVASMKAPVVMPTDMESKRQMEARLAELFGSEERWNNTPLFVRGIDANGAIRDQYVRALDPAHPECDLWIEALPGASAVHLLLRIGDSALRIEIEADADCRLPLHVIWDQQRILRLSSESRAVLTLPPDERYAPPTMPRRALKSGKLDLLFLIDGTIQVLPTSGEPELVPLLDESRSKTWGAFVDQLMSLVAEMRTHYSDVRTGVVCFGEHSMKFISSSPDLVSRYFIYPEGTEEPRLYSYTQDQLRQNMMQLPYTSGGDFVDALGDALQQCGQAGWRSDARRILVLCGDSPGFSFLRPAPAGADIHVRQVDVDQAAAQLYVQHGVEIATVYLGTPASKTKNPYKLSAPKPFLDHARSQYRRLASLPALFWDESSFDPKAAAMALRSVPLLIARGSYYGIATVDSASRENRNSGVEQVAGRSAI